MKNYNYEDDNFKNLNINESIEYNNKKLYISGGIDPERIINIEYLSSLGDFYKCSICFKVMIDPKDCEECGHSYCNECISVLNCPFGCKKKLIKNTSIGIINLLKNIKFKCQNEECDSIIPYNEVKNHDKNCKYQKIKCTNKRCKKRISKCELENHIKNICKYSLIKCQYCKSEFFRKEIIEHEKICFITYQYLKKYNNESNINEINNNLNIYNTSNLNERYFNKYLKNLSINISNIIKENKMFKNKKEENGFKDNNIKQENDINCNKNKSNNNISEKNNVEEIKESMAQIEEEDLVDIIKKALEEKLKSKFEEYEINFDEFSQYLNAIKECVCQLNTIQEVQESDEEEDNEEELNKIKVNNKNNLEDIINIKEMLKKIVDDSELKIKLSLSELEESILNKIKLPNNIYKIKKENNILNIEDVETILNIFANKINENINEYIINILNVYKNISNEEKEINNQNGKNIIKKSSFSNDIVNQIILLLERIIEKNNSQINNNIKNKDKNIKEIYEEKNKLIKKKINQSINDYNDILQQEVIKLNQEIGQIKSFIKEIKSLIKEKTNDISNNLKNQIFDSNNNLIEKIIFNAFNQTNIYVRARSKPIKTLQPHKLGVKNIDINEQRNSSKRTKSFEKKFNSTNTNLPIITGVQNHIKNRTLSFSSNSLYFKEKEIEKNYEDKELMNKIIKIENKLENIYKSIKIVPEQVNKKINKDVLNYFDKLKMVIDSNLEEKIRDKFRLKFCKECEKVEYFYCFKICFNCKDEYCLNNIILCRNCKEFICKECYQKNHKCN